MSERARARDGETSVTEPAGEDDWEWKGERRNGRPYSHWQSLPPLQAPPGVTAVAGQVLRLNGDPLPDVTIKIGSQATRTDKTGRFLLAPVPPGHQEMVIDGRTASRPGRTYGVFVPGIEVTAGQTNVIPFTIWMPKIDTANAVRIDSPLGQK